MKLFSIESKFIAVNEIEVFENRRLMTPLFYVRLSPRRYIFCEKSFGYVYGMKLVVPAGWFYFSGLERVRCDSTKSDQLINLVKQAESQ